MTGKLTDTVRHSYLLELGQTKATGTWTKCFDLQMILEGGLLICPSVERSHLQFSSKNCFSIVLGNVGT